MINTSIGKYKILRLIGEGGMATVYEAEHEILATRVAIKVLNPILSANSQIRERFKNEAKIMASLNHPNIIKVIDFDEQPQQLSIVLELLEGEDLDEKMKKNVPLNDSEISNIFSQTLSAFEYAHSKGIVHRDIKPANIYLLPNGTVKILDFGIAKLFGQGNEMTQTGTQMGTPIFMSPEQIRGEKSIDHRSDIYSLGVTLFVAVSGKSPYDSKTESQFDIFNKIVHEPLPEISGNGKFNQLIYKACHKDREQRFQSCEEWLGEMNNSALKIPKTTKQKKAQDSPSEPAKTIIEPELIQVTSDANANTLSKKPNRTRMIILLSISAFVLLVVVFGVFIYVVQKQAADRWAMDASMEATATEATAEAEVATEATAEAQAAPEAMAPEAATDPAYDYDSDGDDINDAYDEFPYDYDNDGITDAEQRELEQNLQEYGDDMEGGDDL
jgi:serine/threonine protein kinase